MLLYGTSRILGLFLIPRPAKAYTFESRKTINWKKLYTLQDYLTLAKNSAKIY